MSFVQRPGDSVQGRTAASAKALRQRAPGLPEGQEAGERVWDRMSDGKAVGGEIREAAEGRVEFAMTLTKPRHVLRKS